MLCRGALCDGLAAGSSRSERYSGISVSWGSVVDLTFTADEQAFRAEARAWLSANVPHGLPSGDTREGFALHREWERKLFEARWAVVSWPHQYGGREASLIEWLIFEEEY